MVVPAASSVPHVMLMAQPQAISYGPPLLYDPYWERKNLTNCFCKHTLSRLTSRSSASLHQQAHEEFQGDTFWNRVLAASCNIDRNELEDSLFVNNGVSANRFLALG